LRLKLIDHRKGKLNVTLLKKTTKKTRMLLLLSEYVMQIKTSQNGFELQAQL